MLPALAGVGVADAFADADDVGFSAHADAAADAPDNAADADADSLLLSCFCLQSCMGTRTRAARARSAFRAGVCSC